MACTKVAIFFGICGHDQSKIKHSTACSNPPVTISQCGPDTQHTDKCWSPLPQRQVLGYKWDTCKALDCKASKKPLHTLLELRQKWREDVLAFEKDYGYWIEEEAKSKKSNKEERQKEYENLATRRKAADAEEGLTLQIIDLTVPKDQVLRDYLEPIPHDQVLEDEDRKVICGICHEDVRKGQLGPDGEDLDTGIDGAGLIRRVPCPKGDLFHLECIVRWWAKSNDNPSKGEGERCPGCRNDLRTRFAFFNGVEEPIKRWIPINEISGASLEDIGYGGYLLTIGGYVRLDLTMSHRRRHVMELVPFKTLPDRWGQLPNGEFEEQPEWLTRL